MSNLKSHIFSFNTKSGGTVQVDMNPGKDGNGKSCYFVMVSDPKTGKCVFSENAYPSGDLERQARSQAALNGFGPIEP